MHGCGPPWSRQHCSQRFSERRVRATNRIFQAVLLAARRGAPACRAAAATSGWSAGTTSASRPGAQAGAVGREDPAAAATAVEDLAGPALARAGPAPARAGQLGRQAAPAPTLQAVPAVAVMGRAATEAPPERRATAHTRCSTRVHASVRRNSAAARQQTCVSRGLRQRAAAVVGCAASKPTAASNAKGGTRSWTAAIASAQPVHATAPRTTPATRPAARARAAPGHLAAAEV